MSISSRIPNTKRYSGTLKVLFFTILASSFTSCESYLSFEKMRFNILIFVFIGSLIIGFLGMLFSDKN